MKISFRFKIYLLALLTAGILVIVVIFVVIPLQNKIKGLSQNIFDQRVNLEFIAQQRQDIVHLEREIKEIQIKKERISPAVFTSNNTLELITALETIAQNNNLENQKLNLSNPAVLDSGMMISTLNIDVTTSYKNLINWLGEIEKQPFYIIIDSIDLKSALSRAGSTVESLDERLITAAIAAKIYWK